MEVMQHIGTDTVRCIMLSPSEGLQKICLSYLQEWVLKFQLEHKI